MSVRRVRVRCLLGWRVSDLRFDGGGQEIRERTGRGRSSSRVVMSTKRIISIRVTPEERDDLKRRADALGVPLATFVRRSLGLADPRRPGRPRKEEQPTEGGDA